MKTSISPIVNNPKDYNLTEEYLADFMERTKDLMRNRSMPMNITKGLSGNESTNRTDICLDYCDSQMRDIFDDYRGYHGYVTLVVSNYFHHNKYRGR